MKLILCLIRQVVVRRFSVKLLFCCAFVLYIIEEPQTRQNQNNVKSSFSVYSGRQQWTAVWAEGWGGGVASLQSSAGSEHRGSRHLANNLGLVRN